MSVTFPNLVSPPVKHSGIQSSHCCFMSCPSGGSHKVSDTGDVFMNVLSFRRQFPHHHSHLHLEPGDVRCRQFKRDKGSSLLQYLREPSATISKPSSAHLDMGSSCAKCSVPCWLASEPQCTSQGTVGAGAPDPALPQASGMVALFHEGSSLFPHLPCWPAPPSAGSQLFLLG